MTIVTDYKSTSTVYVDTPGSYQVFENARCVRRCDFVYIYDKTTDKLLFDTHVTELINA